MNRPTNRPLYSDELEEYVDELEKYCDELEEIVDEQNDYKWHDLRKDPKDLPKKDGKYLIYTEALIPFGYNKSELFKNYYVQDYCSDKNMFANVIVNDYVIAWKNIEGFGND